MKGKSFLLFFAVIFVHCVVAVNDLAPKMVFHKSKDTLEKIKEIIRVKEKGLYLRLGDGEISVALGTGALEQSDDAGVSKEMREAFATNGTNVLKSLPLNCKEYGGFEPGMHEGLHYWPYSFCRTYLTKAKQLWGAEITDVYSQVALHHLMINDTDYCVDFFKFLKKSNCTVFIGNQNIPAHIRNALLGSQCKFIPIPPRNAYQHIDRIERECLAALSQTNGYQVVVMAAGPTGIILQKRLWKKLNDVFLFNLGSIVDLLCGWHSTREWIRLVQAKIDVNAFLKQVV